MTRSRFRLTQRRRDTLVIVRSTLVSRDLEHGLWLINGSQAHRWHGRTLAELEQARLIEVEYNSAEMTPPVTLTEEGRRALDSPS